MLQLADMDIRAFRTALEAEGLSRNVSDAIADDVDEQKGELKPESANHRTETTRLVLGACGALGLLIIALRFLPG